MTKEGLLYTKEHEWLKVDGDIVIVGISDYAQGELGDIVFIELPSPGSTISKGDAVAVIEAVKAVSDVYTPCSGEFLEVNEVLKTSPDVINQDPYGEGWMFKIKISNTDELGELLSSEAYKELIGEN